MHEMAVTQSILEIALRHAGDTGRITQLNLIIGDLAGIVDDSVQFYWDILTQGTIAENSKLCFERIATRFHCNDCQQEFEPDAYTFECPHCGSSAVYIVAGKEFRLDSIEIE